MASVGRSAKLYQERRQEYLRTTMRGPGPQVNLADNAVYEMPLEPPNPDPALLGPQDCAPTLDSGRTQVWPYGDKYA